MGSTPYMGSAPYMGSTPYMGSAPYMEVQHLALRILFASCIIQRHFIENMQVEPNGELGWDLVMEVHVWSKMTYMYLFHLFKLKNFIMICSLHVHLHVHCMYICCTYVASLLYGLFSPWRWHSPLCIYDNVHVTH